MVLVVQIILAILALKFIERIVAQRDIKKAFESFVKELWCLITPPCPSVRDRSWSLRIVDTKKPFYNVDCNPGMIVRHGDGTWDYRLREDDDRQCLFACFRRNFLTMPFKNETWMCSLNDDTICIQGEPHILLEDPRLEDARLFTYDQKLYASVTRLHYDVFRSALYKQAIVPLENDQTRPTAIESSLNDYVSKRQMEKNWQFFQIGAKKYAIYSVQPFVVFELAGDDLKPVRKVTDFKWTTPGIQMRCGTPPVWVRDRFFMVVHSKDYKMYAVTLDASLNVVGYTKKPLIDCPGHYIQFPCGLVYDERTDVFLISMGINNKQVAVLKIAKSYLDKDIVRIGHDGRSHERRVLLPRGLNTFARGV
jgi:hypothetical protein